MTNFPQFDNFTSKSMDKWPKRHFPSFWFTENWNTSPDLSEKKKKNVKTLISRKKVVRAKFCNFHTVQWFEDVLIWRKIHTVWKIKTFALTWIFFVKSTCEIDFMEFLKKIVRVKFHNIYSVYLTEWKCKTFSATQIFYVKYFLILAILCSLGGLGFS